MSKAQIVAPEHTAVRVSLWRALHVLIDPPPHVFKDELGLKIVAEENWQQRPDMDPIRTRSPRSAIVARARFIEDLVEEKSKQGVDQYVLLGAGLDTFAQRRTDLISKVKVFEVDQPGPQKWKQQRLKEVGLETPKNLHFVPVDFENKQSWWDQLLLAGFDPAKPAVIASTGVAMYLTHEANVETFKKIAKLAPGSCFAISFLFALHLMPPMERKYMEITMKMAEESGTPFLSLYDPSELVALFGKLGFKKATAFLPDDLALKYFAHRPDQLRPLQGEFIISAEV